MGDSRFQRIDGGNVAEREQCGRAQHAFQVIATYQHHANQNIISIARVVCVKCGATVDPFADVVKKREEESHAGTGEA